MLLSVIAAIYRRLPIRSGLTRLSFNKFVNPLFKHQPPTIMARLRDGTPIEVEPNDYHGRILYLFGSNDLKVAMNVVAFLRPGDAFLDIGANYSTIGFAASHAVGKPGIVHLFEPQKRISDRVEHAIAVGRYSNVQLHRIGLMDVNGSFTISGPANHSGRATFIEHEETVGFQVLETCEVRAIADYVEPLVAGKPFGAKLDIEGAEPKVMPWLLAQPNLRFLVFEGAHQHRELYDCVRKSSLALYGLARDPLRLRIRRIDNFEMMSAFHDLIAIRLGDVNKLPEFVDPRVLARSALYARVP